MTTSYDIASAPASAYTFDALEPPTAQTPAPGLGSGELTGLTQDAKADRFVAWSRELGGDKLYERFQGLTSFEDRAHLLNAVSLFTPPLERSVLAARMNDQARPVWNTSPRPQAAPDATAVATAQRREFDRDPAKAAAPLIAQPILAFGAQGRRLDTPAALTNTIALGLGLDPRPRATTTLYAASLGGITRADLRAGSDRTLQSQGGEGLDPGQQAACAKVTAKLTALGGPTPHVNVMRVVYPVEGRHQLASEALFRVEGSEGKPYLLDAQGAHYESVQDYLSAPARPSGVPIVMPQLDAQLRPVLGADAQPLAQTHQATPGVLQSPTVQKVAAGVVGSATVASLVFPPSAAITWPLVSGSAVLTGGQMDRLGWQWGHQRSDLNPLQNPRVLMDYGSLALGGAGFVRGGMALAGASLAQSTNDVLAAAGNVMGVAETGQAVLTSDGGWFDVGQAALDFAAGRRGGAAGREVHAGGVQVPKGGPPVPHVEAGQPAIQSPTSGTSQPASPAVVQQPVIAVGAEPRKQQMWQVPEELRPTYRSAHERDVRQKAEDLAAIRAAIPQTAETRAAEAAYQRFLGELDPQNRTTIEEINAIAEHLGGLRITGPDTLVYRATNRQRLDFDTMTAAPNPRSSALVFDYGDMQPSPLYPRDEPAYKSAREVGPGLNMSMKPSRNYLDDGRVLMAVRVGDLLERGGTFYIDAGAAATQSIYVTYQGEVPFKLVEPPPPIVRRR